MSLKICQTCNSNSVITSTSLFCNVAMLPLFWQKQVFPAAAGVMVILIFVISNFWTFKWKQVYPETAEIQKILNRVDTCLEAATISQEFKKIGYDIAARNDAKHFIKVLRTIIPQNFSHKYLSPCWETNFSVSIKGRLLESKVGNITFLSNPWNYDFTGKKVFQFVKSKGTFKSNVVCLSKIFLLGLEKCGTTFLYCLMTDGLGRPPLQLRKEPFWWNQLQEYHHHPVIPQPENIPVYLLNFVKAYEMIAGGNYGVVTVDASPNTMNTYNDIYEKTPADLCLLPAIIPEVLLDSKFVVTLRNPTTMLYSEFLFSCKIHMKKRMGSNSPDIFHERIVTKLKQFEHCQKHFSLEWCARNITYDIFSRELPCGRTRISLGMYYVHIRKWLSVSLRDRFLFLTTEEVIKNTEALRKKLWEFMGYNGEYKWVGASACKRMHNTNRYQSDPQLKMRKDTEMILKKFFQPYNRMLAELLGDKKFLWEDS